jgi:hypothetical protein
MNAINDMRELKVRIESAANSIFEFTQKTIGDGKWKEAYTDTRGGQTGRATVRKFAIQTADGRLDRSHSSPLEVATCMMDAWEARDTLCAGKKRWYGIKITVFPTKKCVVDYNYDPNCLAEPGFDDMDDD